MAVVMTQIQNASTGAKSPQSLLTVGGPTDQAEAGAMRALLNDAATVFDISEELALEVLCSNIERLNATSAGGPTNPTSSTSTPSGIRTPAGEEINMPSVGIHCGGSEGSHGPTREEAIQLAILSRRFLSKKVPPIPVKEYIQRIHRFCPMAPGVFLATSAYITRMVLKDKVLQVTPKNMHRLVLAGLHVATKALEDMGYLHSRVAKVGGVSEQELTKLEITFCFMANFELRVDAQMLMDEVKLQSQPANPAN